MGIIDNGRHVALDALAAAITRVSAHNGNPGGSGTANELTGGTPAYARKAITWAAAASGQVASNASVVFDVPAGSNVTHFGFWNTAGSTFYGWAPNQGDTATALMPCNLDAATDVFTSYGHGFTTGMRVTIVDINNAGLPTGFTEGDIYFVIGATTDTFQLSLTSGGAAITVTTSAEVGVQKLILEAFASQGTATLASGAVTLDGRYV